MNEKNYLQLGTVFIISSGLIYTIERLISYLHWYLWVGQKIMDIPIPGINIFIYIFALIGIFFYILGFREIQKNK